MAAALCAIAAPQPSLAATAAGPAKVSITSNGFSPAVIVIPIGTTVRWTNADKTASHSLTGKVSSGGLIRPGGTYQRKFRQPGEYPYADGTHRDTTGTVVVIAGGTRVPKAHGTVTRHYKATLTLAVNDRWTYYDTEFQSTTGICNAEVGSGSREEHLTMKFRRVTYARYPSLGIEDIYSGPVRGKFGSFKVTIKSDAQPSSGPTVACPDGSTQREPTQPDNCSHNFTGDRVVESLSWNPKATSDTFLLSNSGPAINQGDCADANQIVGALVLVGVGKAVLPVNLVGYRVSYDEFTTSRVTTAEVGRIRSGRAFTITRSVSLSFTTPCCDGFASPTVGGVYARVGAIHSYKVSLTIRFTPIG
jgi:plastocyanin